MSSHDHRLHHCAPRRLHGLLVALLLASLGLDACAPHDSEEDVRGPPAASAPAVGAVVSPHADYGGHQVSAEMRSLVDWAVAKGDHGGRPFAVIDKRAAHLHVFDGQGRLVDSSWILLGQAIGDDTVPGIGSKAIADIKPEERTTPAGRFVTMPGRNADGHPVVWVDYDAAVSMHVVITGAPGEHRLARLASPDPRRHRISWGCINVPAAFFADVVQPAFAKNGAVVYVLPEVRTLEEVFPRVSAMPKARGPSG